MNLSFIDIKLLFLQTKKHFKLVTYWYLEYYIKSYVFVYAGLFLFIKNGDMKELNLNNLLVSSQKLAHNWNLYLRCEQKF